MNKSKSILKDKKSRQTSENIRIFNTILNKFEDQNDKVKVNTYWDETKKYWIDIADRADFPHKGITSYATIALSDFDIWLTGDDEPLGVEFLGACYSKYPEFPKMIASCAFNIIIDQSTCQPGLIYPHIVDVYLPDLEMKHMLFVPPFGWNKKFRTLKFKTKVVAWLLIIPISEAELQYAKNNGSDKLRKLFVEKQINFYDLTRKSVI